MDYIDYKYLNMASVYLDNFKKINEQLYNFRCPICLDSQKDKSKSRGYIYVKNDNVKYHCHNCGSPHHRSLYDILEFLSEELFKEYKVEKMKSKFGTDRVFVRGDYDEESNENTIHEEEALEKLKTLSNNRNILLTKFKENRLKKENNFKKYNEYILKEAIKITDLEESHYARKYIIERKIPSERVKDLYFIEDVNMVTSLIDKYKNKTFYKKSAIIIPFRNIRGDINCIQFRFFEGNMRYMTLYIEEFRENLDTIEDIDNISLDGLDLDIPNKYKNQLLNLHVFGLNLIDFSKKVYCCEGPIDSMFIDNGIAVTGTKQYSKLIHLKEFIEYCGGEMIVIFDSDYKYNIDVYNSLLYSINMGMKVVLYDENVQRGNDINDLILKQGWSIENINTYMKSRVFDGLRAKLELAKYKKPIKKKISIDVKTNILSENSFRRGNIDINSSVTKMRARLKNR